MFDATPSTPVRTTCPYCGVGCGVVAQGVETRGDAAHPANAGLLCSKGSALGETLGLERRWLHPTIDGARATWDEALSVAASEFSRAIERHGPQSVAFYLSGQFLTEDYYIANKLMKGFIGSANIDTNSRLCMASSVAGHIRAFGEDIVPGCYEDIELADVVVIVGSNTAWCHPVLYRRLVAARAARGVKIVVIDPRRTSTCDDADLHLPIRLGADVALFNGLLAHLARSACFDARFVDAHTDGFAAALETARAEASSIERIAAATGLTSESIEKFFALFTRTDRVVTLYSQGVNQSSAGVDKVNAIINCHLATGRIGKPGMGPFSLTGQPNAMGGREVGGLANQLAAHMGFTDPAHVDRVRRFWNAPRIATGPGLKAIELFESMREGKIKALWIAGTNPAVSLPRSERVREALKRCAFVVNADVRDTDTSAFARVKLPALGWSEKDGTVTNSERRISRQRAFRPAPGEARADWWMLSRLARRMGFGDAFAHEKPAQIFREHAALSALENDGARAFDLGPLATLSDAEYEALEPVQWPVRESGAGTERLFADHRFSHLDRRARFVATPFRAPVEATDAARPLLLNTGRVRDQWHTMTRTGDVARLASHTQEPCLDIHPDDAARARVSDGEFARVESRHGAALMRVRVTGAQRAGEVFAAMHWSESNASTGPADRLVGAACDPISGQPELKATAAMALKQPMAWHGLLLERAPRVLSAPDYWCRIAISGGHAYALAGIENLATLGEPPSLDKLAAWLGEGISDLAVYADPARGVYRYARFDDGTLAACLFIAREEANLPRREAAFAMFAEGAASGHRARVLAGVPLSGAPDEGPMICACHAVGRARIDAAIVQSGCASVEAIGAATKAGTNCGSCQPEIARLLQEARDAAPPAEVKFVAAA